MHRLLIANVIVIGTLLGTGAAFAHDLWLEREGPARILQRGHRYSAHAGAETLPYEPSFVTAALCIDGGAASGLLPPIKSTPWRTRADCATLVVSTSSGVWSKTPWETVNKPKDQVPGVLRAWRAQESVKRIERWTAVTARPVGDGLDITPLTDPLRLAPDDKITVRVTEKGIPLVNMPVAYHGETRGLTGADGTISLRIRHGGVQLISVSIETPLADGKADSLVRTATLQFELPP